MKIYYNQKWVKESNHNIVYGNGSAEVQTHDVSYINSFDFYTNYPFYLINFV